MLQYSAIATALQGLSHFTVEDLSVTGIIKKKWRQGELYTYEDCLEKVKYDTFKVDVDHIEWETNAQKQVRYLKTLSGAQDVKEENTLEAIRKQWLTISIR